VPSACAPPVVHVRTSLPGRTRDVKLGGRRMPVRSSRRWHLAPRRPPPCTSPHIGRGSCRWSDRVGRSLRTAGCSTVGEPRERTNQPHKFVAGFSAPQAMNVRSPPLRCPREDRGIAQNSAFASSCRPDRAAPAAAIAGPRVTLRRAPEDRTVRAAPISTTVLRCWIEVVCNSARKILLDMNGTRGCHGCERPSRPYV